MRRKPDAVYAIWIEVCSFHCLDIQLTSGIAGNTQPNPAIT